MKFINYLTILVLSIILFTCIEPYKFNINSEAPRLVVFGMINDQDDSCVVNLSYTRPYLSENEEGGNTFTPAIANKVTIKDQDGVIVNLDMHSPGVYITYSIKGKVGNTYTLNIEMPDGKKYQSDPEILPYVADIDKISHEIIEEQRFINNVLFNDIKLEIRAHFKDPASEENFYKWKWLGDATFRFTTYVQPPIGSNIPSTCYYKLRPYATDPYNDELKILDDKNINGRDYQHNILTFKGDNLNFRFYSGVNIMIAQYSLTKKAYIYWEKLKRLIDNQGSVFDPAPFQVIGNIYNINDNEEQVLGYFSATGVKYKRYQFQAATSRTAPPCPPPFPPSADNICIDCRNLQADYSLIPPYYWN